jgi:hypothetical protein
MYVPKEMTWRHLGYVLLAVLAMIVAGVAIDKARAAEVRSQPCGNSAKEGCHDLFIFGQIEFGDDEKFKHEIQAHGITASTVVLHSIGGDVAAALKIGREIKRLGFTTVVGNDMYCVSACAMIWLAGSRRFYDARAKIGFHSAYNMTKRGAYVSGGVNALVGAYYAGLGLPDKAIYFFTAAPPQEMFWLKSDMFEKLEVKAEYLPGAVELTKNGKPYNGAVNFNNVTFRKDGRAPANKSGAVDYTASKDYFMSESSKKM